MPSKCKYAAQGKSRRARHGCVGHQVDDTPLLIRTGPLQVLGIGVDELRCVDVANAVSWSVNLLLRHARYVLGHIGKRTKKSWMGTRQQDTPACEKARIRPKC